MKLFAIINIRVEPAMAFGIYIVHGKVNLMCLPLCFIRFCPGLWQQNPGTSQIRWATFPMQSNSLKVCWSPVGFSKTSVSFLLATFSVEKNASPLNVHKNSPTVLNYFTWRKVPYFFASHSQGCHNEALEVMMMVMLHPQLYC